MKVTCLVAILLVSASAAGCRCGHSPSSGSAPRDPFADVLPTEETRVYVVTDILESFSAVPRRGVCVLPFPVIASWSVPELVRADAAGAEATAPRVPAATLPRIAPASEEIRSSSSLYEKPDLALVAHLRSKLSAESRTGQSVALVVRDGNVLEARGVVADLDLVERALADLNGDVKVSRP